MSNGRANVTGARQGAVLLVVLALGLPSLGRGATRPPRERGPAHTAEVQLTNEEFKALDTFEAHSLAKADKVFAARDFKRAAAEYESFVLEFPKSKAIPYALLRRARGLHLADKRFEAIKEYQQVLDYFPNAVRYAAAALYYIGLCHWENADEEEAMKSWAKMAADADYSRHPLAAWAINRLAEHLAKEGQTERAATHYRQVAVNFRTANPEAAKHAIQQVIPFLVRTQADEAKLRAFYREIGGFGDRPENVDDDLAVSRRYWETVCRVVQEHGRFDEAQASLRERYYRYWAEKLDGKFPDWDDYQIQVAGIRLAADRDVAKWMKRLDEQFERYQKPDDYGRVIRWMGLFAAHKPKVMDYYARLRFEKMSNAQVRDVMKLFYERVGDAKMARNLFGKLRLDDMPDSEKADLAKYFYQRDPDLVEGICARFDDKELGRMELLRFHHARKDAKQGVPLADEVARLPRFAKEALWLKAQLLHWSEKYPQAIAAYQQCDNPPENVWAIAECYVRMGKVEQAVSQLREIEGFFKQHAPEAAMRIARIYREAGMRPQHIASLRAILKKYPESWQSSAAHQELERMGIRMGGGVDAE